MLKEVKHTCPLCGKEATQLEFDEAQCRCGFTVGGPTLLAADGLTDPVRRDRLLAAGRMESPPIATPGIRISSNYADLCAVCWDRRCEPRTAQTPPPVMIRDAALVAGALRGLAFQSDQAIGRYLVIQLPDGTSRNAEREHLYALAPLGEEVEAARRMVAAIADKHGPGRWWSLLDPVHLIEDDGRIKIADVGGVPHVFMRALYVHDPAPAPIKKPLSPYDDLYTEHKAALKAGDWLRARQAKKMLAAGAVRHWQGTAGAVEAVRAQTDAAVSKLLDHLAHPLVYVRGDGNVVAPGRMSTAEARAAVDLNKTVGGRFDAVHTLASYGAITAEQARELLEMPKVEPPKTCECFAANLCDEHRPIAVGDYVRGTGTAYGKPYWFEGTVETAYDCGLSDGSRGVSIRIARGSANYAPGDRIAYANPANLKRVEPLAPEPGKPVDPLDVEYDGVTLREWLERDRFNQQEPARLAHPFTIKPAARAAISAHWSAELRARVAAAKTKERERVVLDIDAEDL